MLSKFQPLITGYTTLGQPRHRASLAECTSDQRATAGGGRMCGPTGALFPSLALLPALLACCAQGIVAPVYECRVGAKWGWACLGPACPHRCLATHNAQSATAPLPHPSAGSTFCLGMSIFGIAFLSVLAGLIDGGYP